ncbi:hypothetical protein PPACK8108_LOCUS11811 [Phakopsora pachyrhizi]|uniref:Uncharacterized protein n=1 Tax=Phakopsora pachyrhizi TaxID=170000 RepID=A0AAV0B3K8_PHAPC|nr:hypothetical protein PPACK8108_LOCUS11563 [Phakopsora pachyrhizi]CAH7676649.1 hypothetical protein PPACK8108_LOCUS11811 [Phakopsora pachyrhizi]
MKEASDKKTYNEDEPPAYQALYPLHCTRPTSCPLQKTQVNGVGKLNRYSNQVAKPFPADWQVSIGPKNSVLRSKAFYEGNENIARRP